MKEASIEEASSWVVVSAPLPAGKDGVSLGQVKTVWSTADIAMSSRDFALKAMASQIAVLIIAVAILLFAMRKFVGRPLADVNRRIGELQAGDITTPVPHAEKGDEIGVVARALTEFCDAARMKLEADAEMVRQREQLDAERQANMSETERSSQAQRKVVEELGTALEKLASGDLTARVPDLGGEFAALQDNFNKALSALEASTSTFRVVPYSLRISQRCYNGNAAPDRTAGRCARADRCGARRDHRNRQGLVRTGDRSRRSCRLDPRCSDIVFADRPFGDHGDGRDRGVFLENRADPQGDR